MEQRVSKSAVTVLLFDPSIKFLPILFTCIIPPPMLLVYIIPPSFTLIVLDFKDGMYFTTSWMYFQDGAEGTIDYRFLSAFYSSYELLKVRKCLLDNKK